MTRATAALPLVLFGCNAGLGVAQTAKTVDPNAGRMTIGLSVMRNEYDAERKGPNVNNYSAEPGFRIGVAKKTDIGFGPWLGLGAQLDVKHELTPRERPYGLAIRGGGGGATGSTNAYSVFVGVIASYAIAPWFTPYGGATFRNFWFVSSNPPDPPDGSRWASRRGYGDGLLHLTVGLRLGEQSGAMYLEYSRWLPMQNDDGDFYRLVPTNIFSFTVGFCITRRCTYG